jgi:AcrR family transcriptional regulator
MATRLTRAERKAQTRAQLTEAADRLFRRQGYGATTLEQIADEAGVTKGAVYSNYASKEDLFLEMFERGEMFVTAANFSMFADQSRSLAERFRIFGEVLAREDEISLSERALSFEVRGLAFRNPRAQDVFAERLRKWADETGQGLDQAAHAWHIEPRVPAPAAALIWFALAEGLANIRALLPDVITEEVFGEATRLLADMFEERDRR